MTSGRVVLTVGTNERNQELLAELLEREGYETRDAGSLAEVDSLLTDPTDLNVALVDVSGFGPEIWSRCRTLHESGVPHLVISPSENPLVEREGLAHGARAVLLKPLAARRLIGLIESLLGSR